MRAPKPHEQAAIFGASYALVVLLLRLRDRVSLRRSVQYAARAAPAAPAYYAAPDGKVFMGSPEWIAEARARYGADNPAAN